MATLYVKSTTGSDAFSGATWLLAKATLVGAFAAASAGDTIYVSQVHAETQASNMTLTSPGTAASPCRVLCGNDGAEPPTALAATATISVTGAFTLSYAGFAYYYGIIFNCGNGSASSTPAHAFTATTPFAFWFDTCSIRLLSTGNGTISFGNISASTDDNLIELSNTTCSFGAVGQTIAPVCRVKWSNTLSALLGTIPTSLFVPAGGNANITKVIGVDLSAAGSGKSLVNINKASPALVYFEDCRLGASVSVTTSTAVGQGGTEVSLINCDDSTGNTNYRFYWQGYPGTITQEATVVRSGGASDGTTAFSRKFVSSANAKFFSPLVGPWFRFWNDTTGGAITVAIEVVTDNVTLTDAEAWVECEYEGTSGNPIGSFTTDRAADILATPANQTTSSATWTTTGLTTPVKQTISVSVTPNKKGWIRARAMLAKASTTMYACPKILSTSASQYMAGPDGDIINAPAAGTGGIKTHPGMTGGMNA